MKYNANLFGHIKLTNQNNIIIERKFENKKMIFIFMFHIN